MKDKIEKPKKKIETLKLIGLICVIIGFTFLFFESFYLFLCILFIVIGLKMIED